VNALVLGGNGFIGSHLVDRLLADGHAVRVFDLCGEKYRAALPGVDYRYAHVRNHAVVSAALDGIDVVFHLISATVPQTSNDDPVHDVTANLVETIHLLQGCVERRVKRFVFVSSGGTVYGRPNRLPVSEDYPTDPECSYGIVKLAIEKYLHLFHHLSGLDYVVLRASNAYGPRQDPSGSQGAVAVFLGKAARGEVIPVWGDGRIVRDYVFVEDLADGIARAGVLANSTRVFNLGSGRGHSLNSVLETIERVTGHKVRVQHMAGRVFDIPSIYLDIERARRDLSWQPRTALEDGIRRTWEFVGGFLSNR